MDTLNDTPHTIEIPLTKGYVAIVDEADSDLTQFKWCVLAVGRLVYAQRRLPMINGKQQAACLHRVIMSRVLSIALARHQEVDHISGDGLDNRRSNLRLASSTQNKWNRTAPLTSISGTYGVTWYAQMQKWRARIKVNGKEINLGLFKDMGDAIAARHAAEVKYFGEFSPLICRD